MTTDAPTEVARYASLPLQRRTTLMHGRASSRTERARPRTARTHRGTGRPGVPAPARRPRSTTPRWRAAAAVGARHPWTLLPHNAVNDHFRLPLRLVTSRRSLRHRLAARADGYVAGRHVDVLFRIRSFLVPPLRDRARSLFRIYVGGEELADLFRGPHRPMWYLRRCLRRLLTPVFRPCRPAAVASRRQSAAGWRPPRHRAGAPACFAVLRHGSQGHPSGWACLRRRPDARPVRFVGTRGSSYRWTDPVGEHRVGLLPLVARRDGSRRRPVRPADPQPPRSRSASIYAWILGARPCVGGWFTAWARSRWSTTALPPRGTGSEYATTPSGRGLSRTYCGVTTSPESPQTAPTLPVVDRPLVDPAEVLPGRRRAHPRQCRRRTTAAKDQVQPARCRLAAEGGPRRGGRPHR